ncbi:sedoheptulokinase [Protopterus annectens]|uniref:sedoheptulokinase n=1 Tax=Protopterus annectens TaxID=7888 RepID=UPI001CFADCD2|nr:sedoheptulokinase [Protopterus annectens]XP_043910265.1 sedoheptulokinase [Protopterus annectens]
MLFCVSANFRHNPLIRMSSPTTSTRFILGIDLGTTSVKAVLLEAKSGTVAASYSRQTEADIQSDVEPRGKEQDVERIVNTLDKCVAALPRHLLQRVGRIGIAGQMHGVMFWKSGQGCCWLEHEGNHIFQPRDVSHLITWEDGRCSSEFLASLPCPQSHLSLATGFGCATIFWYLKHRPEFLNSFDVSGTIQDYVVAMLCDLKRPLMSIQNAASWGYYNTESQSWNMDSLKKSDFPVHLLPEVVKSGRLAGKTSCEWNGVPEGTEVGAALGDMQCSVYSCMIEETDAVMNISTSLQLSYATSTSFTPPSTSDPSSPVAYFPYFDGKYLAVAASLNGGNVLSTFVTMLKHWIQELGLEVCDSTVYDQMIQSALNKGNTELLIQPTLLGERHAPNQLASVSNISVSNLSLGHVIRALCQGIIQNLHCMLPCQHLIKSGVKRIMGSGSALSRNEVLKQEFERLYTLPVAYGKNVDSAVGAAMVMLCDW